MLATSLWLLVASVLSNASVASTGTIQGVVVDGSQLGEPIAGLDVQLRAGMHGVFESVAATKTDFYGKFVFENLPLESKIVYLPGANRSGVHYPGQRVQLEPNRKLAYVKIVAYEANTVSPLVVKRHDIQIESIKNVINVTETILISNPSRSTYVGQSQNDNPPVTLRLSIPPNFDRVTFKNEFYGRRFRIVNHGAETDIPWPPGDTRIEFTYRLASQASAGLYQRVLDLPSSNVRIQVRADNEEDVSCTLPKSIGDGDKRVFAALNGQLPSGFTIELQIGDPVIPWSRYARWGSVVVLAGLVVATLVVGRHCGRLSQRRLADDPVRVSSNRHAA
jgi:hypothetical protein